MKQLRMHNKKNLGKIACTINAILYPTAEPAFRLAGFLLINDKHKWSYSLRRKVCSNLRSEGRKTKSAYIKEISNECIHYLENM